MLLLRHLDVVLLMLALPVFVALDQPLLGWAVGTAAWIGQKALQAALERRAAQADDARRFFGFMAGSLIGRSWLVALSIFAVGIADRDAGLAAAVLALVAFTCYLAISLIMRPTRPQPERSL
jgi:apolipoprotein N-acyltransferase